jgi:energy-coupling factor transporter ATP-binding protein EcfA2
MSNSSQSIWDYRDNFEYDEPLEVNDPRYVDLAEARGSYNQRDILQELGFDPEAKALHWTPRRKYLLFGGHRGCGKSTELRRLANTLSGKDAYYVVFVDALAVLDINNLNYSDILLAQAKVLIDRLAQDRITIEPIFLGSLEAWFEERIESRSHTRALAAEVRAGAKAQGGLPLLASLFASLTLSVRDNTSVREEVRLVVRDSFSQFSRAFNILLAHVNERLVEQGLGQALLFVVDGTDRLQGDEADAFFIRDIHQLRQVESNFIYCAPIDLLLEQGYVGQSFDAVFRLPMVQLLLLEYNSYWWRSHPVVRELPGYRELADT